MLRRAALAAALLLGSACSPGDEADDMGGPAADRDGLGARERALLAELGAGLLDADLENGRRLYRRCSACHTLGEGEAHLVGPNLHGLFGRTAGAQEGFGYSAALGDAEFDWTPERLDEWLASPRTFLPGNRMSFAGLRHADDRRDVIAYIAVETSAVSAAD